MFSREQIVICCASRILAVDGICSVIDSLKIRKGREIRGFNAPLSVGILVIALFSYSEVER